MAFDDIKTRGAIKGSNPGSGGGVLRQVPVFGVVKDNIDPTRAGRLQVYVEDMGGLNPDDSTNWVTVSYMSPFFGFTTPSSQSNAFGEYIRNPSSYGMWNSPPDIGSRVICLFINGDPNFGFYIGCVPKPEVLYMVPAIGGAEYVIPNEGQAAGFGGATRLPVTNLNTNNTGISESASYLDQPKPIHSYQAGILNQQGLIRDPIRGVIGSTAQRESPSRVGWGVSTPGRPIYEGGFTDETIADAANQGAESSSLKVISRRGGHSFVMDDGDIVGRDQLVRIRTSLGHQILMSDDGQTLFIIHANGQSWVELGKEGTIDMYATNSVNVRTQGDLNLHADNNININAGKDLNISASNLNVESHQKTNLRVGADYSTDVIGKCTIKSSGAMALKAGGEASLFSGSTTFINGSKINLNTGSPSVSPTEVKPITQTAHPDTLFDSTKGWAAAPGKLLSVVSRAPAHAPWAMAGQGVNVKINNNASSALPSAPAGAVVQANEASEATPVAMTTPSLVSTAPAVGPVSNAVDQSTTSAMVSQSAVMAAASPAAAAIKTGAGVVEIGGSKIGVVGKMAQSFDQMESGGIIKLGSARLANALVGSGKPIDKVLTPNLFTGKLGVSNLPQYLKNVPAQVSTQVTNFQQSQSQLQSSGLITGKESGSQLSGLIMSTATAGLAATVNFVKNSASSVTGAISSATSAIGGAANTVLGSASAMMSAGSFAGKLSSNTTGGLSSLSTAVSGFLKDAGSGISSIIDRTKGVAASAFSAITASFPTLKANQPQNVREIAEKAKEGAQSSALSSDAANAGSAFSLSNVISATNSGLSGLAGAVNTIGKLVGSSTNSRVGSSSPAARSALAGLSTALNLASTATKAISKLISTPAGSAAATSASATGLAGQPGIEKSMSQVLNNATNSKSAVPGMEGVTALIKNTTSTLTSTVSSIPGSIGGNLTTNATAIQGGLTVGMDYLKKGQTSLTSLASAGLPTSMAAQLDATLSSISSGGPGQVKTPSVAFNTNDRTEVNTQLNSVFGNSKIPLPNFGGNPATMGTSPAVEKLARQGQVLAQINTLRDNRFDLVKAERDASAALSDAKQTLPQGDPQIATLEATYKDANKKIVDLDAQIQELTNRVTSA